MFKLFIKKYKNPKPFKYVFLENSNINNNNNNDCPSAVVSFLLINLAANKVLL